MFDSLEWNVDLNSIRNEFLDRLELSQVVFASDVISVRDKHPGHEASQRCDTVSFTNAKYACINMGRTSFKSAIAVGDCAASVV